MNEECPSCRQIINTSCSRLVKDSCGHIKCRMCLVYEEHGCKICNNEHCIQNIGNYECSPSTKDELNNISTSHKNDTDKEVLPLELVINKDSKLKSNNFELISIDYINNYELYCGDIFNKTKEIYKSCITDIKNNDISKKLYISNIESNNILLNVYPHLSNNVVVKSSSCSKASEICNLECKTEFSRKEKLIKNKSSKHPDRNHITVIPGTPEKYKCNICTKIFRNKKEKCYHDACITGVKPYQCSFCDRSFIKRSHFEYHERIHRGYKPFKCNLCQKAFPQQNKLNRHMYSHTKKQFTCPKCDKKYTKQNDLKNHLDVHNGTTTYSCKVCEKTFRMLTNLKRHLKTHTSERPYVCDECNKSFKDKSLLIRHKKTHGKDRPFSCAHCSRVFLSKSELRRHIAVHSDEKPFSCEYCETLFRRKDNLHRHIRHHHPQHHNPSFNINKIQNSLLETSTKLAKTKQINSKQKQKTKKTQKITSNSIQKTPTKVSVVCISSCDQISSRLDSMGNITPIIRTTNEVSNAVSVINGPISTINTKSDDKTDIKRKTFTYTEPIPLAEAVVINKRIEEKLYPQNVSNHNYFLRNCLNCTDKSYPIPLNQISRTNANLKNSVRKVTLHENSPTEFSSNMQTNFTCDMEQEMKNENNMKLKVDDNSTLIDNFKKCT
ncbi:PREDICTED: zinc finger protein 184-like [Habropoda laboriosa]|uniref:zinc finger protein 184-like n=1 Tax=Habropoda laboriosa TaxID=597456 RepID=UPI00083E09E5|nr:PREDICTED: zinc finger protein 184-like [Habropoda laboriosa]